MKINRATIVYVITVFSIMCVLFGLQYLNNNYNIFFSDSDAKGGAINCDDTTLPETGSTYIDGDWKFYKDQLIISNSESPTCDGVIHVPNSHTRSLTNPGGSFNVKHAHLDCASYILDITGLSKSTKYYITLPSQLGSYCIWANGQAITSNDYNGETFCKYFTASSTSTQVIIEINDFSFGGIYTSPKLSTYESYNAQLTTKKIINAFSFGGFLFFLLSFILIFSIGRRHHENLCITFFMLCASLRFIIKILCTTNKSINDYFISHNHILSILYILFCTIYTIALFVSCNYYFKERKFTKIDKILTISIILLTVFCFIFYPLRHHYMLTALYIFVCYLSILICLIKSIVAINKNIPGAVEYSYAMTCASFGIIFDTFRSSGKITSNTDYALPICLIAMVAFVTVRFTRLDNEAHTALLAAKLQVAERKNDMLLLEVSNVKPHFIYNTLGAIQYLCRHDPESAQDAIITFSNYLRHNINAPSFDSLVSFDNELEHIENYRSLIHYRYQDKIQVKYNIKEKSFFVPPLAIATVVENAVTHGVAMNEEGGIIHISTTLNDNSYTITISDNGPGYNGEPFGVGLNSSYTRITTIQNGTFNIQKNPNAAGTIVTITIPITERKEL